MNETSPISEPATIRPPRDARARAERLLGRRQQLQRRMQQQAIEFQRINERLEIAPEVEAALKTLGDQMFERSLAVVREKLTIALREILDQPLELIAEADHKRGSVVVTFSIRRDGNDEDVMRGQGGSVANVLSVGLRMFALATLDGDRHGRFLVLDEQDCWLRPDLVPRLVKIVRDAGKELGYQTLMISHHDVALFERHANRILRLEPDATGVAKVTRVAPPPDPQDG